MSFKEVKNRKHELVLYRNIGKDAYISIPKPLLRLFKGAYIKILFDPEHNLLALESSNDPTDYRLGARIYCADFFKTYNIPEQHVKVQWQGKRLVGKIQR